MSLWDGVRRAFRAPAERREDVEREVDEELAFHIAMREERLRAKGSRPADAATEARRRFGDVDSIRTECLKTGGAQLRTDWLVRRIDDVQRDVRVALRSLRRTPGFALSAVMLLALGIGGTTAVFSVVNAIYFRPLPYPASERLALVSATLPDPRCDRRCVRAPSFAEVNEWSSHAKSIEAIGTLALRQGAVALPSGTLVLEGATISRVVPELLGLRAMVGRTLTADDFSPLATRVLVLSHSAWQSQFGGDPAIVGQLATIDETSYRIVGVLSLESELGPPLFSFNTRTAEYLVPQTEAENGWPSQVVIRHRAGVDPSVVQAELAASLAHGGDGNWIVVVQPMRDALSARYQGSFRVLLGAASLVLLITCLNVGGLIVARLNDRLPELATRTVLGAGRMQLVQQVATEIAMLAFAGAAGGLLIGFYGTRAARLIPLDRLPFWTPIVMDSRVVALALALTIIGSVGLSLAPIAILSPTRILRGLRELVAAAPSRAKLRGVIVSAEIALSVVLVAAAGMLVKQLVAAERKDLGSAKRSVVFLALSNRQSSGSGMEWSSRVIAGLRSVPGVASVAVRGSPERSRAASTARRDELMRRGPSAARRVAVYVDGRAEPVTDLVFPLPTVVTNEYFDAVGIRMVAGRVFDRTDDAGATAVAIINETAAKRAFPGQRAIGRRIKIEVLGAASDWLTIVGVAADQASPFDRATPDRAELFRPWPQVAAVPGNVAIRVSGESSQMTSVLRDAFRAIDPSTPLAGVASVEDWIDKQLWSTRFTTDIITAFAAFAVLLACLGVYATVSYVVGRSRRELAIRTAVGATRERVVFTVMRSSARMIVLGLAAGVAASFGVSRVLRSTVYASQGQDLTVLAVVGVTMLGAALTSALLPAWRAARADPAAVLRAD